MVIKKETLSPYFIQGARNKNFLQVQETREQKKLVKVQKEMFGSHLSYACVQYV